MVFFLKPTWFSGLDIELELAFAIVTFLVSIYAYKIFRLTKSKDVKFLGTGFLLLSGAYIALSITNFVTMVNIAENHMISFATFADIISLNNLTLFIYIFLYISGLAFLSRTTVKDKSGKVFLLIYIPTIIALLLSSNKLFLFHLLSIIFLSLIAHHYYENYAKNKQTKTRLIFIAFLFLLLGRIHFIFSINHALFYTLGHIFEFISYVLVLISLLKVVRK